MHLQETKKIKKYIIFSTPISKEKSYVEKIFLEEKDSAKWVLHQKSFHNQN